MCGRFTLIQDAKTIADYYAEKSPVAGYTGPNYNVAPSQYAPVETAGGLKLMKWGLIPQWAKDERVGYTMINAVGETVFEKNTFKRPIITQRCLIPASGFYEWLKQDGVRTPYYFTVPRRPIFSFAGFYIVRLDAEGRELFTFAILTTAANELVAPVHGRMPVILAKAEERQWLDPGLIEPERIAGLIDPYPAAEMAAWPVRREVGAVRNNGPQNIEPA